MAISARSSIIQILTPSATTTRCVPSDDIKWCVRNQSDRPSQLQGNMQQLSDRITDRVTDQVADRITPNRVSDHVADHVSIAHHVSTHGDTNRPRANPEPDGSRC